MSGLAFKLNLHEVDSQAELIETLNKSAHKFALLGGGSKWVNKCYYTTVHSSYGILELGLLVNFHGILPQAILSPSRTHLFVGYGNLVTILDLKSGTHVKTLTTPCMFFEFMPEFEDGILVVDELGVLALSENGALLWKVMCTDVVVDWHIVGPALYLMEMEGTEKRGYDLRTGKIISTTMEKSINTDR